MKRIILLALLLCVVLNGILAQKLTVESMTASPMDLSASQYRRMDYAGELCGLVKVRLATPGAVFEGNVIPPVEYKTGEYWVYMTKGSRELHVKHPNYLPIEILFNNFGIRQGVQPLTTYTLTLAMPQTTNPTQTQKLIINYTPITAMVIVDAKVYRSNGSLELELPVGEHSYVIAEDGYDSAEGSIKLNVGSPQTITTSLFRVIDNSLSDAKETRTIQKTDKRTVTQNNESQSKKEAKDDAPKETSTQDTSMNIRGIHKVKKGETLFSITRGYDLTVDELIKANPELMSPEFKLRRGYSLKIPYSATMIVRDNLPPVIQNLINSMVLVEGGTFTMGATPEQGRSANIDEKPTHQVTLDSFSIGKYEVTQEEWEAVMGSNPSGVKGNKLPVEMVSWDDCHEFIDKLNAMTGKHFRLPTEAEWEFAARGGNKSKGYKYSGSNDVSSIGWYNHNSDKMIHPVGLKSPNELGIYDMSGNVIEWCQDWKDEYSKHSQTNPKGASTGYRRVYRGGGWNDEAADCRVSNRYYYQFGSGSTFGLRLAL